MPKPPLGPFELEPSSPPVPLMVVTPVPLLVTLPGDQHADTASRGGTLLPIPVMEIVPGTGSFYSRATQYVDTVFSVRSISLAY